MVEYNFRSAARNRVVIGGLLGFVLCFYLIRESLSFVGFGVLLMSLISSVRAIFQGAPIIGIFLVKIHALTMIFFPFIMVEIDRFFIDSDQLSPQTQKTENSRTALVKESSSNPGGGDPSKVQTNTSPPKRQVPLPRKEVVDPNIEEKVLKFILTFRHIENTGDPTVLSYQYADVVEYDFRRMDRNSLIDSISEVWSNWPKRSRTDQGDPEFAKVDSKSYQVRVLSSFHFENPETNAWWKGNLESTYLVQKTRSNFEITKQIEKISKEEKGGLQIVKGPIAFEAFDGRTIDIPADFPDTVLVSDDSRHPKAESLAVEAANVVRLTLLAESRRDIMDTMRRYAYFVKYFGEDLSSEAIFSDKEAYFMKWPHMEEETISKYSVLVSSKPEITVTVTTKFTTLNPDKSVRRTGEIDHTFKLSKWQSGKGLRIFEQKGKVRNLRSEKNK